MKRLFVITSVIDDGKRGDAGRGDRGPGGYTGSGGHTGLGDGKCSGYASGW